MVHRIVVEDQSLRWYGRPPKIADDSIEFVQLQFHLPEDWDPLVLVAQFTQADTYNMLLDKDVCFLPKELTAGLCKLSLFGYAEGKPMRATSIPLVFQIEESGFVSSAETPIPPTPDLYAQLIEYFSSIAGSGGGGSGSGTINPEYIAAAVEDYLSKNPPEVPDLSDEVERAETAAQRAESANSSAQAALSGAAGAASDASNYAQQAQGFSGSASGSAGFANTRANDADAAATRATEAASDAEAAAGRAEEAAKVTTDLDTTLTQAGKAADAKAVGDAISKLSGGNVDLTGYATEQYVKEYAQPKGEYLTAVPEGYAKTEDIPTKPEDIGAQPSGNYLTEVPSGYATEEFVKNKIAEAELGGEEVDLSGYAQKSELPTKVSQLQNDSGYLTAVPDGYAKTEDIPKNASDIGAQPEGDYALRSEIPSVPVKSVNGKTGAVSLTAADVKARPDSWMPTASDVGAMPNTTKIPSKTSDLTNDSGFITGYTETDPTVPAWAKKSTKPSYSKSEVGLGNVDNVKQYSASNPPPYPVTSVNGKTGVVTLDIPGSYTIPSFWQSALNTAIETVKSLQTGKNCVTFAHFSDNHVRLGYSGALIAEAMKKCHIPFCFYNGDSISSGYIANEGIMISEEEAFENMISVIPDNQFCRSLGNHDGYWAVSASERHTYTREQNYELFMRKRATAQNKQFGDDGTYFFVEDLASKVRFIVLNTNGGSVDDAQIAWFRDVALKVDEGWAVVVFSHQPISNHYHAEISNAADVRAVAAESGAEIIGWFSGHIHRDRIYTGAATNTADDTEGTAMGFKQITITSDRTSIAYEDATKHDIAEDNQSHAIDFVTINRDTKTVNLTRLGIGNNRVYSYDSIILYSITSNLQNVVSNNAVQSVEAGNTYTANLTVLSGYENLTVTVTMGGVDITSTAYSNGVITIGEVTGDVVITATAEESPEPVANIWQTPYKLNSRLNTSETDPGADGVFISAWYPVSQEQLSGDIVLRSNKNIFNHANLSSSGDYLRCYSSTTAGTALLSETVDQSSKFTKAYDSENGIYSLTIKHTWFGAKASEIKYFRWCAKVSTSAITADYFDGCILTINQEIA